MKLSHLAETLIGSEIVKLGGEIRDKIRAGEKIYNFTVGDFDPKIFPIPKALEDAVVRGVSRFRDPGRGQGIAGVRRFISRWDAKLSVRSGTAKIALIPPRDEDVPLQKGLAPFPGAQVQVTLAERVSGGPR